MSDPRIEKLRLKKAKLYLGGGEERIAKQHAAGKRTARERLAQLFDADTFQETHPFMKHRCVDFGMQGKELPGEGVVTGYGLVGGRPLYAVSQDFTVAGGAVGEATAKKISDLQDDALKTGDPIIFINDSGGARIQEGVGSLAGYGDIFYRNVKCFRSGAPDQHHQRALRRRGGLFAGPDRFHHPGSARGPDVHHRAERHQAGHR